MGHGNIVNSNKYITPISDIIENDQKLDKTNIGQERQLCLAALLGWPCVNYAINSCNNFDGNSR